MIDMNPYSTLNFISDHAHYYGVVPVVTFDQSLWYKAIIIIENEEESSSLRSILLTLCGFHTLMSFLGCVGHLMQVTGLREILRKVYEGNTVAHILSGNAVTRALHLPLSKI